MAYPPVIPYHLRRSSRPGPPTASGRDWFSKFRDIATGFAALSVPVVVAVIGGDINLSLQNQEGQLKTLELAIAILDQQPENNNEDRSLRTWARSIVNEYSEFDIPEIVEERALTESPGLYTLTPKSTFSTNIPTVNWQLLVEEPVAPTSLDTDRIILSPDLIQIEYYTGVAWTDRAPAMVLTLLIETFQNTDRIIAVGREESDLPADYILQTELLEFQAEPQANGVTMASARLNARLVRMTDRLIIASASFPASAQATTGGFDDVLIAFDEALGDSMGDVVEWTLRNGAADWSSIDRQRP